MYHRLLQVRQYEELMKPKPELEFHSITMNIQTAQNLSYAKL